MEDIIIQRPRTISISDELLAADARKAGSHVKRRLSSFRADTNLNWGRSHTGSLSTSIRCASIMLLCPIFVFFARIALQAFGGSLSGALSQFLLIGCFEFAARYVPAASFKASAGYIGWLLFQATLYAFLPSKLSTGQLTPAGYLLQYRTNGLLAWLLTHIAFVAAVACGALDSAIIAKNWAGLLAAANAYGFLLSALVYFKAYCYPTHAEDRKFSGRSQIPWLRRSLKFIGSWLYDFYMGIEFNPRLGKRWDFKLFHNGRPGIIAWTLM